jgi:predicted nuclease of predicted toxin-antitoxin system
VKLLFDENVAERVVLQILDLYPESVHVKSLGLQGADDSVIWEYAKENGFTILSKDSDFYQRSLLFGEPPKVIFLRVGNCPTNRIAELLRSEVVLISVFFEDPSASILVLA